ncbi:MAG TPA: HEAT repeat domain-containing protein [Gemmataceae bacterium]|nr:HEAT repeat domain-containing protein [Gemmataceae bacterium]
MHLRIVSPAGKSSDIVVKGPQARLGRNAGSEVFFDPQEYPMVSGEHARIDRAGPELVLTPLSRSNKTLVNDQPVEEAIKIKKGDRIRLGYTGPLVEVVAVGGTLEAAREPLGYVAETSIVSATPPVAPAMPQDMVPAPLQPSAQEKARQSLPKRTRQTAVPCEIPQENHFRLVLEIAKLPKAMLWSAGAIGVIIVAALVFLLTRGRTQGEPEPPHQEITAQKKLEKDPLTRVGPVTKNDLPIYAAALRESSPESRAHAAGRLADLGQEAKSELSFLRVLALDESDVVRDAAQKAVLRIEADLVAGLTRGLKEPSADVRSQAARELAKMGAGAKPALPGLVEALADSNSEVRVAVRGVFVAIGPDAVMVLGEALRDKDPQVRLNALNVLGWMGSDARFVMPDLIAVTFDQDAKAKEEALAALARIGDYAIPYLIQALEREKNLDRQAPLVEALSRIGHDAGPALKKALQAARPEVAAATAGVLPKVSSQPAPELPKDHIGTEGLIQSQLRGWFSATDTNKDNFLDKDELARALRGPKAKPYDYTPDDKPAKKLGPGDFSTYPDYAFLCRIDRDNDGKISKDEFERWAFDYTLVMKQDLDDRDRIQKARERLQERGLTEAMRVQREAAVAQLWANYYNARRSQDFQFQAAVAQLWNTYYNMRFAQNNVYQMEWLQRWALSRLPPRQAKAPGPPPAPPKGPPPARKKQVS